MKTNFSALVKREFTLATPWQIYLFAILGIMTCIPSYPSIVGFGYVALAIFTVAQQRKINRDMEFTIALPVERKSVVSANAIFLVGFEGLFLVFGVIGALIARFITAPAGNIVGLDANFTLFGAVLLSYSAFNYIYLTQFFKTVYKAGKAVLLGILAFVILYGLIEVLVNLIPGANAIFDGYNIANLGYRIIAFIVSAGVFVIINFWAVMRAQKNFEKVNL